MTKTFNVAEAKARLSEILDEAVDGTEVVIARRGVPLVRLVPVVAKTARRFGTAKGLIQMADDFDEPLEEFEEYR